MLFRSVMHNDLRHPGFKNRRQRSPRRGDVRKVADQCFGTLAICAKLLRQTVCFIGGGTGMYDDVQTILRETSADRCSDRAGATGNKCAHSGCLYCGVEHDRTAAGSERFSRCGGDCKAINKAIRHRTVLRDADQQGAMTRIIQPVAVQVEGA